ncbi:MAG: superinfection immunity protein [Clostridia bacterium]|nr:superinfection immunity protein [Clostridia bacterium]
MVFLALGIFVYFIPSFIANKKQHTQKTGILLLNIFLGWTFIGWVVALIWANLKDMNVSEKEN